jgi:hypothetical protein
MKERTCNENSCQEPPPETRGSAGIHSSVGAEGRTEGRKEEIGAYIYGYKYTV